MSNCEDFIVSTHSFDIEEQHSTQASISDGWMVTRKPAQNTIPVLFNNIEGSWYFPNDRNEMPKCQPRLFTNDLFLGYI